MAPVPFSELNGDALAIRLFSTQRNPNRQRAPQQDSGAYSTTGHSSALPNASRESRILPSLARGQFHTDISPAVRAELSMLSRNQINPGPGLSGIPLAHSTDTLPLYESRPSSNRTEDNRQAAVTASGSRPSEPGGAVRRAGTGWSAVSQSSGPPPSYRTVDSRQNARRPGRG
ncbi:hypothetical protein VP1G_03847 [Cytospora mali]|uniref:Uncharacterized protein n=1 Tax=Cytospora mali TaxID=578113 RepID=A0A194UXT7_CYTMA|nr:hypothetical protein VP1G_03847 [Valsa mali var. pyri (nom. inval.)]